MPREKGINAGDEKRKIRCRRCQTVFSASLNETGAYPSYPSSLPKQSFIPGQTDTSGIPLAKTSRGFRPSDTVPNIASLGKKRELKKMTPYRSPNRQFQSNRISSLENDFSDMSDTKIWKMPGPTNEGFDIASDRARIRDLTPMSTVISDMPKAATIQMPGAENIHKGKTIILKMTTGVALSLGILVSVVLFFLSTSANEIVQEEFPEEKKETGDLMVAEEMLSSPPREPELHAAVKLITKYYAKNQPILIVNGIVSNVSPDDKSEIIVEAKMLDSDGSALFAATGPCGMLYRYRRLGGTKRESIGDLYKKGGKLYNCSIRSGGEKKFQLVFDGIPRDFDKDFTIKIKAFSSMDTEAPGKNSSRF